MVRKVDAIKNFLEKNTHRDLAHMYNENMECQVNVNQGDGEIIVKEYKGKRWSGFTDGLNTWKPFRIPFNADVEPQYNLNEEMNFDLSQHAQAIGMTGWDWVNKKSCWVAFDFDAITGHSDKHTSKLTPDQLQLVQDAACSIDWVTVRFSTGGRGLHLYVFLDIEEVINNHSEHAAVGRAVLCKMCGLAGYDFTSKVDICGQNIWVWHEKLKNSENGLKLIKLGSVLTELPANWREHLNVVKGKTKKVKHVIGSIEIEEKFEQLAGKRARIALDEDHKTLINWLNENAEHNSWWDADHHMLVTHTHDLLRAHEELGLKGIFKTVSEGMAAEQNCFAFPMRRGAWGVRRYSLGCIEDPSWEQDGKGWTKCYFNHEPDLRVASAANEGVENPKGGYVFRSGEQAQQTIVQIGGNIKFPLPLIPRRTEITKHKDGKRIVIKVPRESHDDHENMRGWLEEKNFWIKIVNCNISNDLEVDSDDLDDVFRHIVMEEGDDAGWVVQVEGKWREEPLTHVKHAMQSMGYSSAETNLMVGDSVLKPWKIVCRPFEPIYLGDRQWNRNSPQLLYVPNKNEKRSYPHWKMIIDHIGRGLDEAVAESNWCKINGLMTGSDYLKCWISCLFQYPLSPLPYLFLYSESQNTGKSILHESLSLLFYPGCARASTALASSTFNAELEGAILCVVEETNLNSNESAYIKIKDWVTSPVLPIHKKTLTPYDVPNTTHWIHCANNKTACPIFSGDTRIVMIEVPTLETIIPKEEFIQLLQKEASDFLGEILSIEIPPTNDRLRIPPIETQAKRDSIVSQQNAVQTFIEERCFDAPGYSIPLKEFYEAFRVWLDPMERYQWSTKNKVSAAMPSKYPKGRNSTSQWAWGNISFTPPEEERKPLIVRRDFLVCNS